MDTCITLFLYIKILMRMATNSAKCNQHNPFLYRCYIKPVEFFSHAAVLHSEMKEFLVLFCSLDSSHMCNQEYIS